jgi:cytochrome c
MRSAGWTSMAVAAVALALAGGFVGNHLEAKRRLDQRVRALTGGDPQAGRAALAEKPCGGCHQIPGVQGAAGKVGPPLTGFSGRIYIAGRLNNTPDNLTAWIMNPHAVDPQNAMPQTGVSPQEARDMAAYLYTLR